MAAGGRDAIRRKIGAAQTAGMQGDGGAETGARAWRLSLGRAAQAELGLALEVTALAEGRRSLPELLELLPERALLAVLEGPRDGLGVLALSPDLLAAVIEMQTIGRLAPVPPLPRRPTRTDAAMAAGLIDRALADLDQALAEVEDRVWASGFRYASFLEDARPLGLMLEDQAYRTLSATLDIGAGLRQGAALLALPAAGRGTRPATPAPAPGARAGAAQARAWTAGMEAVVMATQVRLDGAIARIRLPLSAVLGLAPGAVLPLGAAALDAVALETADGGRIALCRLGQNRGQRALRLTRVEDLPVPPDTAAAPPRPAAVPTPAAPAPLARSA
ncbi:FliM/FliN family flagellar motor switch protein [Ruixingdingia sedimenti]|uniref:FliM/FliN family flagellar motor switch protein n=1 Tax=Ruixingdingia sedimenti TaxID=3073604 RepID=A0ABU1F5E5_9RHOB|nr:FliM/FliN family flagellar motor switch protein [Xinfangfangia sp. LG-4]MDR5652087.1 FliM/FliN family flagellar motor switch protein [Xinfangfangia sp. LG-4]